jgi:hypothetical protein
MTYALSPQRNHIEVLGPKAILYKGPSDLKKILLNFDKTWYQQQDWDCYSRDFSPAAVMQKFDEVFLNSKALKQAEIQITGLDKALVQTKRLRKKIRSLSRKLYL